MTTIVESPATERVWPPKVTVPSALKISRAVVPAICRVQTAGSTTAGVDSAGAGAVEVF